MAAEVLAYEDAHRGESFWDFGVAIAEAHGTTIWNVTDDVLRLKDRRDVAAVPKVRVRKIDPNGMRLVPLEHLSTRQVRVRGVSSYVTEAGRRRYGVAPFVLVREPTNKHDANAIAVYGQGRMVGHVSAGIAAQIAPLLDRVPCDGFLVDGGVEPMGEHRMVQLQVHLPFVPALRGFVGSRTEDDA